MPAYLCSGIQQLAQTALHTVYATINLQLKYFEMHYKLKQRVFLE